MSAGYDILYMVQNDKSHVLMVGLTGLQTCNTRKDHTDGLDNILIIELIVKSIFMDAISLG